MEGGLQPGFVVAGKYRVEHMLGEGGMGIVVAATHIQLEQPVAIKLVRPEALGRPEVVNRLLREARAVARLHSEHVVRVIDVGTLPDGSPFVVMEYLHGQDLSVLVDQGGRLPVPVAVDYVLQACDAIAEAHSLGIVHRDLKPANLFLSESSHGRKTLKVLDFGIAKTQSPGDLSMTGTSAIMGSPAYMSPEQLRSAKGVDGRSDIWSLGVILWQLVTGMTPFNADSFTELCIHIVVDPLPRLPMIPGLPSALEAILRRALEKDPVERFQTVVEFANALMPFANATTRERAERISLQTGPTLNGNAGNSTADSTIDRAMGQRAFQTGDPVDGVPKKKRLWLRGAIVGTVIAAVSATVLVAALPGTPDGKAANIPAANPEAPPAEPKVEKPTPPTPPTTPEPVVTPPSKPETPETPPPPTTPTEPTPTEPTPPPKAEVPKPVVEPLPAATPDAGAQPAAEKPRIPKQPKPPKPPRDKKPGGEVDPFNSPD